MNCRTFQKNLEDYLESGLDFAGRFGMERHARQCFLCGKELENAERLRRLVRGLDRVRAPRNFESVVLNEIASQKLHSRFSMFRRFLVFGFGMPSWKTYALAASGILAVGLGFYYWQGHEVPGRSQVSPLAAVEPVKPVDSAATGKTQFSPNGFPALPMQDTIVNMNGRMPRTPMESLYVDYQASPSDYREYRAVGPDNLPMIIPLPDRIQMQVSPPPEEYYLRNVSH
jgi:hypothetical protein